MDNTAMARILPSDFGLTERAIEEIRVRDERQALLFARFLLTGCGALWLLLTALIYAYSARRAPLLGLVMAPLLGGLGAVIGGLPIAILGAVVSWLAYPTHPQAGALQRYEAATAGIRVCDVCRLACWRQHAERGGHLLRTVRCLDLPGVPATLRPAGDRGAQARPGRGGAGRRRPRLTPSTGRRARRRRAQGAGVGPRDST